MKIKTLMALAVITPWLDAPAEPFTIDWSTIDGGGSTSSSPGGEVSLSGTIGQPDTGQMTGGPFSLQGGFWGRYGVIQTPDGPLLTIARLPNGNLRVAWELPADGWILEESPSLGQDPTPWVDVPVGTYQTGPTQRFIIITAPAGKRFYRLHRP